MNKQMILCLFCLFSFTFLYCHEGHKHQEANTTEHKNTTPASDESPVNQVDGTTLTLMKSIGSYHFIFLHFPIALISMTAISELLFTWSQKPIFDDASRFMLISAAVFSVPTALLGLTYSFTAAYSGLLADLIFWHMWLGITTAALAIFTASLREFLGRSKLYYISLTLLFLLVNITAFFGGKMTFGSY